MVSQQKGAKLGLSMCLSVGEGYPESGGLPSARAWKVMEHDGFVALTGPHSTSSIDIAGWCYATLLLSSRMHLRTASLLIQMTQWMKYLTKLAKVCQLHATSSEMSDSSRSCCDHLDFLFHIVVICLCIAACICLASGISSTCFLYISDVMNSVSVLLTSRSWVCALASFPIIGEHMQLASVKTWTGRQPSNWAWIHASVGRMEIGCCRYKM